MSTQGDSSYVEMDDSSDQQDSGSGSKYSINADPNSNGAKSCLLRLITYGMRTDASKTLRDTTVAPSSSKSWSNRFQFLLASIGFAVGIGNVWRFPYIAYTYGGGAFLIPYILAICFLGLPLFMLELLLGQLTRTHATASWHKVHHRLAGLGMATGVVSIVVGSYYTVLLGWSLLYFGHSFRSPLPWAAPFNVTTNATYAQSFFEDDVLHLTSSIGKVTIPDWQQVLALLAVSIFVFVCTVKGTKILGKVVLITVITPYVLLVVLFFRGVTLKGAGNGILFFVKPDFSKLADIEVWIQATTQVFFSLSPGFGVITLYGSWMPAKQKSKIDIFVIVIVNSLTSIFAGFVVFAILGHLAHVTGRPIDSVAQDGPGLAFIVYPEALALMPGRNFFAVVFFLMLLMLGVDSQFGFMESIVYALTSVPFLKNLKVYWVSLIVTCLLFVGGIIYTTGSGLYWLGLFDHFVPTFALIAMGFLEFVGIAWIFGATNFFNEVEKQTGQKYSRVWAWIWMYIAPVVLLVLGVATVVKEIQKPFKDMPQWALALGWMVAIIPLVVIFVAAVMGKPSSKDNSDGVLSRNIANESDEEIQLEDI